MGGGRGTGRRKGRGGGGMGRGERGIGRGERGRGIREGGSIIHICVSLRVLPLASAVHHCTATAVLTLHVCR